MLDRGILDAAGNPMGADYTWDFAMTSTWIGPTLGNWSDPANWSGNTVPPAGASVVFTDSNAPRVVLGGTSVVVDGLQVNGETTLVNVLLNVTGDLSLNADLAFSGRINCRQAGSSKIRTHRGCVRVSR
jgi:hypothetical protein